MIKNFTYLESHHDNESVVDDLVVGQVLGFIIHDLTICDQLLGISRLSMGLSNVGFQGSNLKT